MLGRLRNLPISPLSNRWRPDVAYDNRCDRAFFYVLVLFVFVLLSRIAIVSVAGPIDMQLCAISIFISVIYLLMAIVFERKLHLPMIAAVVRGGALVKIGSIAIAPFARYVFYIGRNFPLEDRMFERADRLLGFDWLTYVSFIAHRPYLLIVMYVSYYSIWLQPAVIGSTLILSRKVERFYAFFATQMVCIFSTVIAATLTPCLGGYAYTHASLPVLRLLGCDVDKMTAPLLALRAGNFAVGGDAPLVQFPSYHAAAALIYIWAAWGTALRWPAIILNVAMLCSAPVCGSHYLVDLLIGLTFAAVCIWGVPLFVEGRSPSMLEGGEVVAQAK